MTLYIGEPKVLPFVIPSTELLAGTPINLVSPVDGVIEGIDVVVQTAIGTGGAITVKVGTTDVTGLSVSLGDSAAVGTVASDDATDGSDTRKVTIGQRIQIVPAAAFATTGAVNGQLRIRTADRTKQEAL